MVMTMMTMMMYPPHHNSPIRCNPVLPQTAYGIRGTRCTVTGVAPPPTATAVLVPAALLLLLLLLLLLDDDDVSSPPHQSNPMQSRFTANGIRHTPHGVRCSCSHGTRFTASCCSSSSSSAHDVPAATVLVRASIDVSSRPVGPFSLPTIVLYGERHTAFLLPALFLLSSSSSSSIRLYGERHMAFLLPALYDRQLLVCCFVLAYHAALQKRSFFYLKK